MKKYPTLEEQVTHLQKLIQDDLQQAVFAYVARDVKKSTSLLRTYWVHTVKLAKLQGTKVPTVCADPLVFFKYWDARNGRFEEHRPLDTGEGPDAQPSGVPRSPKPKSGEGFRALKASHPKIRKDN